MAHFMLRWKLTDASAKSLVGNPHDRSNAAKSLIEGMGGKLHTYYFSLGEFDGLAICEFADVAMAAACSMAATGQGGFAHVETTALLTAREAESAMKHARDTKTDYKPPHA